jgi:chromosome partitioning protein
VEAFFQDQSSRRSSWSSGIVFDTRIRRNIRLAEAPSHGQSIFEYAPHSHGAVDYRKLCGEVVNLRKAQRRAA